MIRQITAILIGAGNRGADTFGEYALENPESIKIIAVAEPQKARREKFVKKHEISEENSFESWEPLLDKEKFADVALIMTQDQMHYEPAIKAMNLGYDVLLEKPMATTLKECKSLADVSESTGKILQICHGLRFGPFFSVIKSIIESGKIGGVVNISLRENVSPFHYAHSYVRGHWHNREKSSPMILAKSCHDMDILFWLVGQRVQRLSSFGSQKYFGRDNMPDGAPDYCIQGCPIEKSCLYNASRIYLDIIPLLQIGAKSSKGLEKFIVKSVLKFPKLTNLPLFRKVKSYSEWPVSTISSDMSRDGKIKALNETNYGRCVYKMDEHNVVDHQVVNIEFNDKTTATFTLHGFSNEEGRTIRVDGTKGTIIGEFLASGDNLILYDHLTDKKTIVRKTGRLSGHGGGDVSIMETFLKNVKSETTQDVLTNARASLESHLMAFAVDIARIEKRVVEMEEFR
ncbi:MAG: Gfo/Idh/MocA family oxidoreductase [Candidatus Heimdallarchaeota archaeon]|nr:Gfo/Idh/MocA family oxidoreductase [Candidatus Heimdallarchaeota archaeon]